MKNYVALPNQSEEDYIEWFSDFEQYESDASNTESKLTKCLSIIEKVKVTNECIRATEKDIERINYDISVIKDAQHPYNDDCWACRQQTWKVHLTNLGDQLINCKEQLDLHHKTKASLLGKRTLERLQKIAQAYQSWYDDWNEMKSEKAAWETLRMQWSKYKPFHKKLVELEEQEQELSKQIVEINTKLKSLKKEEQEASANYKNSKQEYDTLLICKENLPRWKSTSSMIKKHDALWVEYKKRLESINDANTANEYIEENKNWEIIKSQLNDYEKWDTKLNILKDQYSQYDIECKLIEAYLSQEQLLKIKEDIDKHTTKKQMERELSYWTNIRDLKPDFNQKAELSTRLEEAKENERIAAAKYHQVEIMYKQCENARTEANDDFRSNVSDKLSSLVTEYIASKTISTDSLNNLSLLNNPVTEEQIKNIALMPKSKQYIAISKLAAGIAYFKTISKYRQAMDDLLEAMRAPGLDDVQRGVLERDYNYLKEKLDRFKEERQAYKDYNETVSGILSESEKEKLNAIINNDRTTSYFSDSNEAQDKKEMYLPSANDKGK